MPGTDRLLLVNAVMGQFLTGFASRIFIVSLPTIAVALNADILGISWALIAYQLASIGLSVVFGRLGDVHGRYTIYGLGFAIMAVSSLLCGLAGNVLLLVLFRAVQGIGAAMISSATRVLAMDAMPEGSEGKANGLMTMSYHSGFLVGPPLGGLVIDWLSWRWVFFLLVPLGAAGVVLTAMRARRGRMPTHGDRPPIDYLGAALLVAITVALTLLLDRRSADIVGAGSTGAMGLVLGAALLGFVVQEWRASHPVVNLALFRIRMFTVSVVSLLVLGTANSVLGLLLPFYMQGVLHLSPSFMGLVFLGAPVATIVCAALSGLLTDRLGPRPPTSIGIVLTLGAFAVGFMLRVDSSWLLPALAMVFTGLGTGFFNTANQAALVGSVPREYRGFATGMVQTVFGVGSLLGISLAGVLMSAAFRHYTGAAGTAPSPAEPVPFVASINTTCLVCAALVAVALFASLLRGQARIEAAPRLG
jgi:EmrB/QacA subfamily drug resistance transporter